MTDALKTRDASDIKALNVRLAATHLGYVNENKFRYVDGEATDNSLKSWFEPFGKPVVTFHNDQEDPLGRVYDARREDLQLQDGDDKDNRPTGVVVLDALITDPDAIKKVLDGTYLTVSTSCSSKDIRCSICDSNVSSKEDKCDHEKGKTYDDQVCVWNVGQRKYSEVSFVNTPADQSEDHFAGVVHVGDDDSTDSEEVILIRDSIELSGEAKEAHIKVEIEDEKEEEPKDVTAWTAHDFKLAAHVAEAMKEKLGDKFYEGDDAFCGPHTDKKSTFPLPDMEHINAAIEILDNYNGRGSKAKLTSVVLMKKASFEAADDNQDLSFTEKIADLEKKIADLTELLSDEKVLEHEAVKTKLEDVQKDIEEKSDTISKLQTQVDALKTQLDEQPDESDLMKAMVDENTGLYQLVQRLRATLLVDLQMSAGKLPDLVTAEKFFDNRSEAISKVISDMDGHQIASAYDALGAETKFGTYQKPDEPTQGTDNPVLDNDPDEKIVDSTKEESGSDMIKRIILKKSNK